MARNCQVHNKMRNGRSLLIFLIVTQQWTQHLCLGSSPHVAPHKTSFRRASHPPEEAKHTIEDFIVKEVPPEPRKKLPSYNARSILLANGKSVYVSSTESPTVLQIGSHTVNVSQQKLATLTARDLDELAALEQRIQDLLNTYSSYKDMPIDEELVKQYEKSRADLPKFKKTLHRLAREDTMTSSSEANPPRWSPASGQRSRSFKSMDFDFSGAHNRRPNQEEHKVYPPRLWGDECVPDTSEDGSQDECYNYTKETFGASNNAKLLSCDPEDRICLCAEDDNGKRAEYSKMYEICLIPRYYRCNTTSQCEPLLTCEKATERDYVNDEKIPKGSPKICRLKVNFTSAATGPLTKPGIPWTPNLLVLPVVLVETLKNR